MPEDSSEPALDETERKRLEWRLQVMESRRQEADTFTWGVPGLAVAAQAFLLSIALDPGTKPLGRLLAALAGLAVVLASLHLLVKQAFNFDFAEGSIERDRCRLKLPAIQRDDLLREAAEGPFPFPGGTQLVKRGWLKEKSWHHRVGFKTKALWVWGVALLLLLAVDLFLLGYSIWALACGDPGWL